MVLRLALTLLPGVLLALLSACRPSEPGPTLDLPPRPEGAPGGSEIGDQLRALDSDAWERRIAVEVDRGNVPGWFRRLEPIQPVFPVDPDRPPHFSVGVRLVDRRVLLDGEWRDLEELLEDAELQGLLLEGPGSLAR